MAVCSFCGTTIEAGTGKMYVKKDGKVLYFCSSKCEKNLLMLRRKARNITWTQTYQKAKEAVKQSKRG